METTETRVRCDMLIPVSEYGCGSRPLDRTEIERYKYQTRVYCDYCSAVAYISWLDGKQHITVACRKRGGK